jgi:predicted PurR-regulated permease PerM
MSLNRVVEYVFFFVILVGAGYMVWQVLSPFVTALALALIIVTICYPMYELFERHVYRHNKSLAAGLTTATAVFLIVLPLAFISSVFVREMVSFYQSLSTGEELSIERYAANFEATVQQFLPGFTVDFTDQIRQSAEWFVGNLGTIFAGTVSTIFIVLIALIGSFYFFRDGREFLKILIKVSPLPDRDDEVILSRMARAVRSVATGVLLVSLIQGTLAALGFTIFGIERAVLWGAVGAILAMIPGIGTPAIMVPGILYLFFTGSLGAAIGLLIWMTLTIIIVDNIIGPQLMSRGNNLHPFIVLTAVLGGISTFGPIGFIVGPVIVTLFIVLLEIYNQYLVKDKRPDK